MPLPRLAGVLAAAATALALTAPARSATTAASPRCHTSNLRMRAGVPNGAAGTQLVYVYVRNISRHTCHTRGYPGFLLVSATGHSLPTHVSHDAFAVPRRVTLRPRQLAHFAIAFHVVDLTRGGRSCGSPTARYVHVIPPDEYTFRSVRLRDGGITPCHGVLSERPVTR